MNNQEMKATYNETKAESYSEPLALEALIKNIQAALNEQNEAMESNREIDPAVDSFKIIINRQEISFYLGGPQAEGLYRFVQQIAAENFYEVDIKNATVTGW